MSPSRSAERLGHLALLPFSGGAALCWSGSVETHALALRALVGYAAVVASFIGAVHWGFGFVEVDPRTSLFVWGVVPSIVAWLSLLAPPRPGLAVEAALLAVCFVVARAVYPRHGAGRWLALRLRLTVPAVASCVLGALAG